MRFVAVVVAAALSAMLAPGPASAQSIVKIFHFDQNGVLPSADPDIELFTASPSASESDVYSVLGALSMSSSFCAAATSSIFSSAANSCARRSRAA